MTSRDTRATLQSEMSSFTKKKLLWWNDPTKLIKTDKNIGRKKKYENVFRAIFFSFFKRNIHFIFFQNFLCLPTSFNKVYGKLWTPILNLTTFIFPPHNKKKKINQKQFIPSYLYKIIPLFIHQLIVSSNKVCK